MSNNLEPSNFFGHSEVSEILNKRVSHFKEGYRQNLALVGNELSGKTRIVKYFLEEFKDEQIIHVYVDFSQGEFSSLAYKFVGGLLYNYFISRNLPVKDDLNYLIVEYKNIIPKTIQVVKKIVSYLEKNKIVDAYRDMISLPEVFINETGKYCLIIIDEFQRLEEMGISSPFQQLGKKIVSQKNCMFIFISSNETRARQILSEDLALLFGNFEIVKVGNFDVKTSQDFIDKALDKIQIRCEYKNFIVNFTGGSPFYLNLLCKNLISIIRDEFVIELTLPLLVKGLKSLIFDEWGILNRKFSNCIDRLSSGKNNNIYISVLLAIAEGHRKLKEINQYVHKDKKDVSLKINRLLELGLISKNVNSFYISDKIFNFWLRHVFSRRLKTISQNPKETEVIFTRQTEALIRNFVDISEKDTSERIVELFNLFTTETLQLDGHRYRFFSFKEVKPLAFNDKDNKTLKGAMAKANDCLWFILLKEDRFIEEDVLAFLSECRKYRYRPQRRIIISIGDMDNNAKLRALKDKIWVWDLSDLNTVLNLYDRPFIVK